MTVAPYAASHGSHLVPPPRSAVLPARYCPIPQRLIADLHDTAVAIGVYALIGRLFLVTKTPVSLSRADVLRYDPALKPGAVVRAFARLIARGWIIEDTSATKRCYTPAWGIVRGAALPWDMGKPCLGRPRHIIRLALNLALLDTCMGKLTPHTTLAATITRYLTVPALSLADVGSYALALGDIPRTTPALEWLGVVRNGQVCSLPPEAHILALCSQRTLTLEDNLLPQPALTPAGARRLGMIASGALPISSDTSQPLFFVPAGQTGILIADLIPRQIGHEVLPTSAESASPSAALLHSSAPAEITWEDKENKETRNPPPTPSTIGRGGGDNGHFLKKERKHSAPEVPDTEATLLLRSLHIRPAALIRHAETPLAQITAAIADARTRPYINDIGAWVVSLLDDVIQHGHIIAPLQRLDQPVTDNRWDGACQADIDAIDQSSSDKSIGSVTEDVPLLIHTEQLTEHVRGELRWRCRSRNLQGVINSLMIEETSAKMRVVCASRIDAARVQEHLSPMLEVIFRSCGRMQPLYVCISSPPVQLPVAGDQDAGRPPWLALDHWLRLSGLVRIALRGATLENNTIRCVSPQLDQLIHTRYQTEINALLAAYTVCNEQ